jgi:hypothetical protein
VTNNATAGASYSYDAAKKEFVSYDTPEIVKQKAKYIQDKGLAGAMFWCAPYFVSESATADVHQGALDGQEGRGLARVRHARRVRRARPDREPHQVRAPNMGVVSN